MKRIALIVNPIAGIGGKVGLKGSDGAETLRKALSLGAKPEAGLKAAVALSRLAGQECEVITFPAEMGEDVCQMAGIPCTVVGEIRSGKTTPEDTERAVRELTALHPDLLLFAGGDGTARNVASVLGDAAQNDTFTLGDSVRSDASTLGDSVRSDASVPGDSQIPVLGIPAGCKIHSAVYALNPRAAGELLERFCKGNVKRTRQAEVMDIDEDLFRQNIVQARLYGYLNVLDEKRLVQNLKSGRVASGPEAIGQIAVYFRETLEPDTLYVMGTGSTVAVLMKELGLPNTLLGVDLVYNGPAPAGASSSDIDTSAPADASASDHQDPAPSGASSSDTGTSDTGPHLIASDCTEAEILAALDKYPCAKIVVTVIGGQGYIFGRGNQQLSAEVIRRVGTENIIIAAGKETVMLLPGFELHADTGDESVNQMLSGYRQIIVGYEEKMVMKVTV